jgi:hypothetical protein
LYEGTFVNGKMHGEGTVSKLKNGSVVKMKIEWNDGRKVNVAEIN